MSAERVASSLGCRLLRGEGKSALWDCPDSSAVVALLRELARDDVALPEVRTLAGQMRAAVGADAVALAREVHGFVLSRVRWVREKVETFQSSAETLRRGFGDCDDHARLIFALLRALGIPARIEILYRDGEPAHAVTRALLPGGPVWLETSVPAKFGEAPLEAAARLGLHTRLNMPSGLAGLAGLTWNSGTGWSATGSRVETVFTGAVVGAALTAPFGSAVGLVVGALVPSWSAAKGAGIGSGVGALLGALGGASFALDVTRKGPQ